MLAKKRYVMAVDDGTTGIRAMIFDHDASVVSQSYELISPIVPRAGWLEQDGLEVWEKCVVVMKKALKEAKLSASDIACVGISCQRTTSLLWDKSTGKPLCNAITWQDTRSADLCQKAYDASKMKTIRSLGKMTKGLSKVVPSIRKSASGARLVTAANLSFPTASSLGHNQWMLENTKGVSEVLASGNLLCGTIDSWLIWKMTKGSVFATDFSNASSTGMFDTFQLKWSDLFLDLFKIPLEILPEIKQTSDDFGMMDKGVLGSEIPIGSAVADQQSSLFAQGCFEPGMVKCTNGTGTFIDMNVGDKPPASMYRLLPLIAWKLNGRVTYMLEGMINTTGSAVEWMQKNVGLIKNPAESEKLSFGVSDTGGVYFVPAFTGLSSPYWDPHASGIVVGLSRKTTREHLVRSALEGIAYRCKDVLHAMELDTGLSIKGLKADGGASQNNFLLQFMSDMLDAKVDRPVMLEGTALGAAYLAGLSQGFWDSKEEILKTHKIEKSFSPAMSNQKRDQLYDGWKKAIKRSFLWREDVLELVEEMAQ